MDPQKRKTIVKRRKGAATNNDLEYLAVIYGIEYARKYYPRDKIIIKSDSMLVIKQVKQLWKIKSATLAILNRKVLSKMTKSMAVSWVPREANLAGIHLEDIKDSLSPSKDTLK